MGGADGINGVGGMAAGSGVIGAPGAIGATTPGTGRGVGREGVAALDRAVARGGATREGATGVAAGGVSSGTGGGAGISLGGAGGAAGSVTAAGGVGGGAASFWARTGPMADKAAKIITNKTEWEFLITESFILMVVLLIISPGILREKRHRVVTIL
jgi:hypothetical protein